MRLKIMTALLLAGTVVGCASNPPPPPPPMAEAPPPPAPPPAPVSMDGTYRGTASLADGAPRSCHQMTAPQTARVRNNVINVAGLHATVGADGTIAPVGRNHQLTGTISNGTADIVIVRGHCSYHYTLNHT